MLILTLSLMKIGPSCTGCFFVASARSSGVLFTEVMSSVAHVSELAQSMDPLQYVRASPQGIPDEHLNPSPEVVRLVHAPAGYTCKVHLPSSLPPEGVGIVNLAGQRPSSHSGTAASASASITLGSFALRVTKKDHADINREINRCGRLPEVAILPTILAWDPAQGRVLMPRFYPVPLDLVGSKQVVRLISDMRMALSIPHHPRRCQTCKHHGTSGPSELRSHRLRWLPGVALACQARLHGGRPGRCSAPASGGVHYPSFRVPSQ